MAEESTVFKSGPLFISSKGLGWTSWKKRWFILTRTSLVFYRSDPSTLNQKGAEANLTLGGIELNNSGSVVVKADKKLITVLFPDGRDGRAFTLKAETSEDLLEWKTALENALAQAPNASLLLAQNSIFRSDTLDAIEGIPEQGKEEEVLKPAIVGGPVILALEDTDGNPSFLEKALRFIEQHGVKIEGILRQSADVEEVKRRVEEYEQGRSEFTADEDAHLIGDCIKYVLREVPSAPVPASCCTALLEAFKSDRGTRVSRMRNVIAKTFPEPNRCLLQRILKMMTVIASHKSENRMSVSAVAACMAPLLLRPLLAGDCELENNVDMGGDGSFQLLQAAAAANHAQAIVIILLDEYDKIFTDDYLHEEYFSSEVYSESEDADGEDDDYDDDDGDDEYEDSTDNEIEEDNDDEDVEDEENVDTDYHPGQSTSGTSDGSENMESDFADKVSISHHSDSVYSEMDEKSEAFEPTLDPTHASPFHHDIDTPDIHPPIVHLSGSPRNNHNLSEKNDLHSSVIENHKSSSDSMLNERLLVSHSPSLPDRKIDLVCNSKRSAVWGRAPGKKLSMESIDYTVDDDAAIQRLEAAKADLENRIKFEVKENELLQETLNRRKESLCERRLALQEDVQQLQEQLQRERSLRASLEGGLVNLQHGLPISSSIDGRTRKDIEEIVRAEADIINLKQQVADLHSQLNHNQQKPYDSPCQSCGQPRQSLKKVIHEEFGTYPASKCDASFEINENNLPTASCRNEKSQKEDIPSYPNRQQSRRLHQKTQKLEGKSLKARCNDPIVLGQYLQSGRQEEDPSQQTKTAGLCSAAPAGNEVVSEDIMRPKDKLPEAKFFRSLNVSKTQIQDSSKSQNAELSEEHNINSQAGSNCMDTSSSQKEEPTLPWTSVVSHNAHDVLDGGENILSVPESRKEKPLLLEASPSSQNKQPSQSQPEKQCQIGKSTAEVSGSSTENSSVGTVNLASLKCYKGENHVLGRNFDSLKGQVLDSPPLRRRQPPKRQQPGIGNASMRSASPGCNSFALAEPSFSSSSSTKKISARVDDAASSTSALTRLTNRLNFLKERRVQLTNELQAIEGGHGQCTEPPASRMSFR